METKNKSTNISYIFEENKFKEISKLNKPHKGPKEVPNKEGYIFELSNVQKLYSNGYFINNVLKDINLSIKEGEFIIILGKSGSGKTTLLNIMSGLTRATSGSVVVNNHELINMTNNDLINFRRKYVGYIFQEYGLLSTLNIRDNVLMGFNLNSEDRDSKEIDDVIRMIGLEDHVKKFPSELSGGQQQRVAIARAIAKKPKIIFADEPTGALDSQMGTAILRLLKQINHDLNTTIVLITHDESIAKIGDRVIVIENGFVKENIINENPDKI